MSKEVGAGRRFDIFLDSEYVYDSVLYMIRITGDYPLGRALS